MQLNNGSHTRPARSGQAGVDDMLAAEHELLARTRTVARRITERVRQTLGDTHTHEKLPAEEAPALS
jgi:hypothetical protein